MVGLCAGLNGPILWMSSKPLPAVVALPINTGTSLRANRAMLGDHGKHRCQRWFVLLDPKLPETPHMAECTALFVQQGVTPLPPAQVNGKHHKVLFTSSKLTNSTRPDNPYCSIDIKGIQAGQRAEAR